jgi:hypothetical protein
MSDLKHTAVAVRVWRKNTQGSVKEMPADLQRDTVKLLEAHSWEEVCQATGIGKSTLAFFRRCHRDQLQLRPRRVPRKRRPARERTNPAMPGKTVNAEFLEVPLVGVHPRLHVELRLPSGVIVHAHSAVDPGAVSAFVARLLADAPMVAA